MLAAIRAMEKAAGLGGLDRVKVVMTTASKDRRNVMGAFRSERDGYLIKPISKAALMSNLTELGLLA